MLERLFFYHLSKLPCFELNQEVSSEGRSQGRKCLDSEGEQTAQEMLLEVMLRASGNKSSVSYVQRLALGLFFFFTNISSEFHGKI